MLEMVLKLIVLGPRTYFADQFNIFDCSLVSLSVLDKATSGLLGNVNMFRPLRVLRLARVLRLLRLGQALKPLAKVLKIV